MEPNRRRSVGRQFWPFALAGVAAVVLVGLTTAVASRRVGEREAIVDARTTTLVIAQGLVEPKVENGLVTGDAAAVDRVRQVIGTQVRNRSLRRVKIWTPDGTIV